MALPLESYRQSGPPETGRRRGLRPGTDAAASTSVADALHLISRQHQAVSAHSLQPVSAFNAAADLIPVENGDRTSRNSIPGRCPEVTRVRPPESFRQLSDSVYYAPSQFNRCRPQASRFPPPLIEPRTRRRHTIHIVSYPPGFVPRELRTGARALQPPPDRSEEESGQWRERETGKPEREAEKQKRKGKARRKEKKQRRKADQEREEEQADRQEKRLSWRFLPPSAEKVSRVIGKISSVLCIPPKPPVDLLGDQTTRSRSASLIGFPRTPSAIGTSTAEAVLANTAPAPALAPAPASDPTSMMTGASAAPGPRRRPTAMAAAPAQANRNSILSTRSTKSGASTSGSEIRQKPIAQGSGLSCTILMAEPNVFLTGFDHRAHGDTDLPSTSALLRGKLQLAVSKNVKIKSIALKLVGKARTEWPEGIPPAKVDTFEEQTLRTQSLVFFHAMHQGKWDTEYGMQCTYVHHEPSPWGGLLHGTGSNTSLHLLGKNRASTLTAKELKRLSLQSVQSRSFGKDDSPLISQVQAKGYKVFRPGTYEYSFELPIDHTQLETTKLQFGSVRWTLETTIERAGAFKPDLRGSREVSIVRLPDEMSLEMVEPISISRRWEDQLHYDIIISGKSFPIGGKIPIAFRLTPLAKVQVHKLKVFITESIEYWTNDRRVTRKDPGHKILLMEKTAGRPVDWRFSSSELRVLSGGEPTSAQRAAAWEEAQRRRQRDPRNRGNSRPMPEPANNLLGDLDLGLDSSWGSTELEMNVQLPTCSMMERHKEFKLHPDCSWKNVNVFHWIKIVMRVSRVDKDDPAGKRRRHFEISIDSPLTILNCRATQANTLLPRYSGAGGPPVPEQHPQMMCGCPDAQPLDLNMAGLARPLTLVEEDFSLGRRLRFDRRTEPSPLSRQQDLRSPALPETSQTPPESDRPIHLIRYPSHNPPAFDADEPPPPLQTPPPNYDTVVGTPSRDGLADYFTRLAAYEGERLTPTLEESVAPREVERPESDEEGDKDSDTLTIGPETRPGDGNEIDADGHVDPLSRGNVAGSQNDDDSNHAIRGRGEEPTQEKPPESELTVPHNEDDNDDHGDHPHDHHQYLFRRHHSAVNFSPIHDANMDGHHSNNTDDENGSPGQESDSDSDTGAARPHRRGRVNVPNPRTPGGRLLPSRSLEIERPVVRLDMSGVLRRKGIAKP
ncbi:hypothetical protein VTJ83DRAFT_1425 [Remersonia thermophila]|uniref:Arrestin C-terminal-like domain-containing protein n=1 Tax=Remersonia thermophila TaxID=72144 RepID=A0ABR4DS50_9PEZI